ncbi:MAG: peptidylprolyl isomerase [Pseudomonadota bacterium]
MIARDLPRFRGAALWLATAATMLCLAAPAYAQLRMGPGAAPAPAARPAPAPAAAQATRQADYIVAVVNSEPITNNEARARLGRIERDLEQQGTRPPPREQLARLVLDRLITERAQLQLARQGGIRVDEAMVDAAELNVARQNRVTLADLHRRLATEGISVESFRQDLRNELILARLRDREVTPRVRVTEGEVEQFLREQETAAAAGPQDLNLGHILVAVPEDAAPALARELQAKAERIQQRAQRGEDFAALAREFSDAPGAATTGGVIGMRPADRYPPLFVEATQRLPVGGVSAVVRSGAGFHVLKLVEKRQPSSAGAVVVQQHARHILLRPNAQLTEAAARQRLEDFKRRIDNGLATFADLARDHSQDASARNGGDLGWAGPGTFVPEFEEALNALRPGQVSPPVQSRFGLHLIQLVERREQALGPRELREIARNQLREKKEQEAYIQWAIDVRGRAYVEYREPPQ